MMDTDALPAELRKPLVVRAFEELKMLTQTDLERERYESRRKAQLDYHSGLNAARLEGQMEGEKAGLIRTIHLCQQLIDQPESLVTEMAALPIEELTRLAEELQQKVLQQRHANR